MLQNRVNPFGQIIKTSARGAWMGNRGVLHDDQQQIRRTYKTIAWITCLLQFKNWKRTVMTPRRYTELFFMDEATAFSAGHRLCFECRRKDYDRFKSCWLKGNAAYGFDDSASIKEIDKILQQERIDPQGNKVSYMDGVGNLPDGSFIVYHDQPYVIVKPAMYAWSPAGYTAREALPPPEETVKVLTPLSIVNTFRAGYVPEILLPEVLQ
ncbi:hypothetical protein ACTJJ0_21405 [Chitinophaga sp. 22321]|uniref:Uncharacterized protein n=1 Tax=Chitinophaga hostae TaxID=2831022 RepID=A0ABS5J4H3_9BACT|nr:hypothetical protein [Chitinophaga hostae]MBS0030045.1 hypothetical protein [Chitinophaga hostae]